MTMPPALNRMMAQLEAAFKDGTWNTCLPTFSTYAERVRHCDALQEELRKIKEHMSLRNKSWVSFDAVAERSQVTLNMMIMVFEDMISQIEPLPSQPHIEHLIDTIRAAELLLTAVQSSHHVFDLFNRWYFLLCPSYYPGSRRAEPSTHNKMLRELLQILGLMVCVVVPPNEELHRNFSGEYAWFREPADHGFELSTAALREGMDAKAGVCEVFGVSTSWFQTGEAEPTTRHCLSGVDVDLNFFHHVMQYTQGFATDKGSFVRNFEGRLFGVFEDFLSMTVGQLKKQLEASQSTKTKILTEFQTKAFTAVQMLAQALFHCLTFCHL
mmetsp:Transcript_70495/g.199951  ORF Transcript_70495/g.199951 Transcript_70495/m.199951 type:complete len:326 (+) Transcript_70495:68-1045(+)